MSEVQGNTQVEDYTGLLHSDIKKEWDWVKVGLEEINARDPDPKQTPEDVYAACRYGRAKLFIMDNKQLFVVLSEFRESDEIIHLVVWYCWASNRGQKKMKTWLPDVEKYAKENGYTSVMCESAHIGIAEYAIDHHGYFIDTIVIKKFV